MTNQLPSQEEFIYLYRRAWNTFRFDSAECYARVLRQEYGMTDEEIDALKTQDAEAVTQ